MNEEVYHNMKKNIIHQKYILLFIIRYIIHQKVIINTNKIINETTISFLFGFKFLKKVNAKYQKSVEDSKGSTFAQSEKIWLQLKSATAL